MISVAATNAPPSATNAWAHEFSHNETAVRDWAERFAGFPQQFSLGRPINYWWVNQNQTYKAEVQGGFLWSPKTRVDGARNKFYDNMADVRQGDIIFSFCDTRIKAVGTATAQATTAPKPHVHGQAEGWASEGWHVPVKFHELEKRIRPKDHIKVLRAHLPSKYSPLQDNGDGLQSVYLAGISDSLAHELIKLIGQEYHSAISMISTDICFATNDDDAQQQTILGRTDIGATTKSQLIEARRGQGIFKSNVRLNETGCRVTGVQDTAHLRASHIKPWSRSDDFEKLNGCNGLLLAPHIDHLFDSGNISFADDGVLLVSPSLQLSILHAWGIDPSKNVGKFNAEQIKFLEFHRSSIFKR